LGDHSLLDGRYEIVDTVAARTGSTVHKALDQRLGITVALKVLVVDDVNTRDDLIAETKTLQLLEPHGGLPRLRNDFDLDDGSYVVVIDWVDGIDLDAKLDRDGRPGLVHSSVVDWIGQVADALDHLHAQDPPIVHGDVKPSNLVLTRTNRVVLLDFGIARIAGQTSQAGTRGFMAPEVGAGEPVTPATDVYGLAATTYALLTGVPPSPGPLDVPDVDPSLMAHLRQVLLHGLAMDPARRYATAGEFAERLRAHNRGLPGPGDVTLLATEFVDYDALWDQKPSLMDEIDLRVESLVRIAVDEADGGVSIDSGGERMLAGFSGASAALRTALAIRARVGEDVVLREHGVRLRMALHTGEPEDVNRQYRGAAVNKVRVLCRSADGCQILASATTALLLVDRLPSGTRLVEMPVVSSTSPTTGVGPIHSVETDSIRPLTPSPPSAPIDIAPIVAPPVSAPPPRRAVSDRMVALVRERDDLDVQVETKLQQEAEAQRAGQPGLAAGFRRAAEELEKRRIEVQREIEGLEAQEHGGAAK